jgi:class 3 adenylate cyclase
MIELIRYTSVKTISIFVLFLLVNVFLTASYAQTKSILVLDQEIDRYKVGQYLEILEDENKEYTIEEVSSPRLSKLFKPLKSDSINLGLKDSAVWVRFTVQEDKFTEEKGVNLKEWVFDTGKSDNFDFADFFCPDCVESPEFVEEKWSVERAGKLRTEDGKCFLHKPSVFALPRFSVSPKTLYLRVESIGSMWLIPMIYSKESYLKESKKENILVGIYYGIILILAFISLYTFFVLKDRTYLYYAFYVVTIGLWFLFDQGIIVSYFFPSLGKLNTQLTLMDYWLLLFSALLFVRSFLMMKTYALSIFRLFQLIMAAILALMILTPFADFLLMNQIASMLGLITIIMIIIGGIVCFSRGFQPARLFIIAWAVILTGGAIKFLSFLGLIPITKLGFHSFQIASGIEVVLIGFSILDRIRILRRERKHLMDIFGKYVSKEIRDEILAGSIPLDGESKEVTVLFSDLRDFTTMVEASAPKDVVIIINDYFTDMSYAINQHHGLVLQYVGDEIEAVFGAPIALVDHPNHAVRAALDMRNRLEVVNSKLGKKGYGALRHGIGVHTGVVVAANIGSPDRLSYALVGDTVNVASRIQELNKEYNTDILISATTRAYLDSDITVEKLPERKVKGKRKPVEIFKVI